jgi:hypothetical protein
MDVAPESHAECDFAEESMTVSERRFITDAI